MADENNTPDKEKIKEKLKKKTIAAEKKEKEFEELFSIIKPLTPGTPLRNAIDDVSRAEMGALIVIGDTPEVAQITNGGLKINCKFTPQQLVELCKMDGAIVLSEDMKKIVYCNTQLIPDPEIKTKETGTRHRAAERTAKQTSKLVVCVSERRKTVTLYYKNVKYVLRRSQELLNKAHEALRMLDKHKEILNELMISLNALEFTNIASLDEVVAAVQRIEIISRISRTIKRYVLELGVEGSFVKFLLKEMIKNLDREKELLLRDYSKDWEYTKRALASLSFDDLIEPENIAHIFLYPSTSEKAIPKGYRMLSKTSLEEQEIEKIVNKLSSLENIMGAVSSGTDEMPELIGEENSKRFEKEIETLKERALLGKKI